MRYEAFFQATRRIKTEGLAATNSSRGQYGGMITWEYLIVELPSFEKPTHVPGGSHAVHALNAEGGRGWEAVGLTPLADGKVVVLLKRPRPT